MTRFTTTILGILLTMLVSANLAAQEFEAAGLHFNIISNTEVEVTKACVDGTSLYKGVVLIPETVNYNGDNYTVAAIATEAFAHSGVTEVQIPNTVTTIGESAFAYAENLKSITLPLHLKAVSKTMLAGTAIENIAIPEGVTTIGYGAFQSCLQLRTVMLPSTLTLIDAYGFNNCQSLFEIYCAAPIPPKATGWAIFIGLSGIDVILPDDDAVEAYTADKVWGDSETFSLWTNEDISISMSLVGDMYRDNWMKVELGNNIAYRIYGEDGEEMAITAADNYYFPIPDHQVDFIVVPTNMIKDCDDKFAISIGTSGVEEAIEEQHPNIHVIDGTIYISGDNHGKWTTVYDVYGNLYYQRPSINNVIGDLPRNKVYIVIVGKYVKKVFL